MWTKVRFNGFVGPGFMDSGIVFLTLKLWDEEVIYFDSEVDIKLLPQAVRLALVTTEISKIEILSTEVIPPMKTWSVTKSVHNVTYYYRNGEKRVKTAYWIDSPE